MRIILLLKSFLPVIALTLTITPTFASQTAIQWHTGDLNSGLEAAESQDKPVFAVFYMSWCGPSQFLLEETFQDQTLGQYVNQNTVPILLEGNDYPDLFNSYGVHSYPSVLIIRSTGEEIERIEGIEDSAAIELTRYRPVIENGKTPSDLLLELVNDPANADIKYELLIKYARREQIDDAMAFKAKLEVDHPGYYLAIRANALFAIADALFSARRYDEAIASFQYIIDQIPEGKHEEAFYYIALSYFRSSRAELSLKTLDFAIEKFPLNVDFYSEYLNIAWYENIELDRAAILGEQARQLSIDDIQKGWLCFLLARIYKSSNNIVKAGEVIDEAIALDPQEDYISFREELIINRTYLDHIAASKVKSSTQALPEAP